MRRTIFHAAVIAASVVGLTSAWPASASTPDHEAHAAQVLSDRTERLRAQASGRASRLCVGGPDWLSEDCRVKEA